MPAPIYPRIKTLTQLDNHSVEIQTKTNRAQAIYWYLKNYDYDPVTNSHPMVGFAWFIPTNGIKIEFDTGAGEMVYDGVTYSGLNNDQKVIFWQWIDKFVVQCMKNYDKTYGF